MQNEWMELFMREEPLREELVPFVSDGPLGKMLHHKWLIEIALDETHCARVNKRYEFISEKTQQALAQGDYFHYVFLHERPYRLEAFLEIQDKLADGKYWELVASIWIDTENFWQHKDAWLEIWSSPRYGRECVMDPEERHALAKLPSRTLTIYRGIQDRDASDGLSWTRDKQKAIWFARRYNKTGEAYLCVGKVRKGDILAYFLDRGEKEVVVLPDSVMSLKIQDL